MDKLPVKRYAVKDETIFKLAGPMPIWRCSDISIKKIGINQLKLCLFIIFTDKINGSRVILLLMQEIAFY